jgi:hypothetical protein
MKRYGDTWGCRANTEKSRILLVWRPHCGLWTLWPGLVSMTFAGAALPPQVVDKVKHLGVWFTSAWSWDSHIATAYRKGLAQAGPPCLSTSARAPPLRPVSESLPLLSCALAGVGRLGVRPRSIPRC